MVWSKVSFVSNMFSLWTTVCNTTESFWIYFIGGNFQLLKNWEEEFYLVNQHIFTSGPLRLDSLWDSRGRTTFLSQKYLWIFYWSVGHALIWTVQKVYLAFSFLQKGSFVTRITLSKIQMTHCTLNWKIFLMVSFLELCQIVSWGKKGDNRFELGLSPVAQLTS